MKTWRWHLTALLLLLLAAPAQVRGQQLTIAVASNFYHSLKHLLADSEFANKVKLSSGSTGLLYAQILKGAPFDILLAADTIRAQRLVEQGLAYPAQTYAKGELVLWPTHLPAKQALNKVTAKLVIANPQFAPYGQAAIETLQALGLAAKLQAKLVMANNINQAFQFVDSGNGQLALLAKSQLLQAQQKFAADGNKHKDYAHYQSIPEHWHRAIIQQAVVLKRTEQAKLAQRFMTWLTSPAVQQKLLSLGYRSIE